MFVISLGISVRIFNIFILRLFKIFTPFISFISSRVSSSIHSFLLRCWISLNVCEFFITCSYSCLKIHLCFWEDSGFDRGTFSMVFGHGLDVLPDRL